MGLKVRLEDGSGTGTTATITSRGELVVGNIAHSSSYSVEATVINTAYNFVGPLAGKRFVITDILLASDRNIGNNGADIDVYEATASDSITVSKEILGMELLKNSFRDLTGLNLIASEGVWVNVKTNDNNIFATLMGYYVTA